MAAGSTNLVVTPEGTVRLGREGQHPIPPAEGFGSFGGRALVTGVEITPDGQVFLADPHGDRILHFRNPLGDGERPGQAPDHWPFRVLWRASEPPAPEHPEAMLEPEGPPSGATVDPYRLSGPTDVARSPRGNLVVADPGHGRLVVYSWPELRVVEIVRVPEGEPRALAFDSAGRAYVADPANGRVWRYDVLWRVDPEYGGVGPGDEPSLAEPLHVAVDADGRVFVVDRGTQRVLLLDESGHPPAEAPAVAPELRGASFPPPLEISEDGTLTHVQRDRPRCPRLVLRGVRVDRRGRLDGTDLPLVARRQRIVLPRSGSYRSVPLDGEASEFPWHRVVLETEVPESTRLVVSTFTDENPLEQERLEERAEEWSRPLVITAGDVPEILVQSPPGRYLWIRIDFLGDGEHTPSLRRIDVHGPRRSSLRWLPPPFHEVEESADFLDRFLSYFDTVYAETEETLQGFTRMLDPWAVPPGEFLEWLGSWFDWRFLAEWPEPTRREMIAHSVRFFRERGTVKGLRRLLRWHTGVPEPFPHVIEHFRLRGYASRRSDAGTGLPGGRLPIGGRPLDGMDGAAHRFTVVLPSSAVPDAEARRQVARLVEAQKPAHTAFAVRSVQPGLRVGCQSSVGVDTWLAGYPGEVLDQATLGGTTRLETEHTPGPRLGAHLLSDRSEDAVP